MNFFKKKKDKILLLSVTLVVLTGIWINQYVLYNQRFSEDKWKNNPEMRSDLIDNLVNSRILIGKSSAEIEDILGKTANYYNTGTVSGKEMRRMMEYEISMAGFGLLKESLRIDLRNDTAALVYRYHNKDKTKIPPAIEYNKR